MTIGTLSARIMMDASGVQSGLGLTRAEMKLTRQAFLDSTSDVQKLETALRTLESARDKGAFADEEQYAAAIAAVRAQLDPTVQAEQRAAEAAEQLATKLRDQIATFGMSAEQIDLWRLQQQGATQATVDSVAALQRDAQALRDQDAAAAAAAAGANQLEQEVEQLADALRQEAATAGMSADQARIWKLEQQGASQASVQMIRNLQAQRTAAQHAAGGHRDLSGGLQNVISGAGGAIPGVSGLTSTLQLGHPVLIAAAIAVGGIAIAYKAAKAAADWYVGGVKDALDSIDQLSNKAKTLGNSVQDVREIRFAMKELAEIDAGQADKQMEKLSKAIGDANAGSKAQSDAFQRLGIDSRKLADAGAVESIQAIAGAMEGIPSRTERIRITQQLFGKDSADLVNFLTAGQAAIDASTDALRRYGGVITDIDAAQIEATNDAWGRVSTAVGALTERAAIQLAPALQVAAERVLELLDPATSAGGSLAMILDAVPPVLTGIINLADILIGEFQLAQAGAMGFANAAIQAAAGADRAMAAIIPGKEVNADLQSFAAEYEKDLAGLQKSAEQRLGRGLTGGAQKDMARVRADAREAAAAAAAAAKEKPIDLTPTIDDDWLSKGGKDPFAASASPASDVAVQGQDALAKSIESVGDKLLEQQAAWGLTAEQAEIAGLAAQGASESELRYIEMMQEQLAELRRAKESAESRVELDAIADQTDPLRQQALAARGLTAEQAKSLAMAKLQGSSAADLAAREQQMAALTKAERGKEMADRIRGIREEVALQQLRADPLERMRLAERGITAEQSLELKNLKEQGYEVAGLEAAWRDAAQAKNLAAGTSTTVEASGGAAAYDSMQAFREKSQLAGQLGGGDRYAGIGEPIPALDVPPITTTTTDPQQLSLLDRIAKGIEAWAEQAGITVEEVRI